jgi:hypothetical protein
MKIIFIILLLLVGIKMFSTLTNLSVQIYKTPFGKMILNGLGIMSLIVFILFTGSYSFSFFNEGNFFMAFVVANILRPLGIHFVATPFVNMLLDSLLCFIFVALVWVTPSKFLKMLNKNQRQNIFIEETKIILKEGSTKLEFSKDDVLTIFRFGALWIMLEQLLLFQFIAYPNQLPTFVFPGLLFFGGCVGFYGTLYLLSMKIIFVNILMQSLFQDRERYKEVTELFEATLKKEEVLLTAADLTQEVETFVQANILRVPQGLKGTLFPNVNTLRVTISKEYLILYEKYKGKVEMQELDKM